LIRVGLIGASRIAREAIIAPAKLSTDIELRAIAASNRARAETYAEEHTIARALDDYHALVRADDIDLVYIGLPPHAHMEWAIAAMKRGKHVLCEKPIALNADQAAMMVACAQECGVHLIEAFHYRYHPLMLRTLSIVEGGGLGDIIDVVAHFSVPVRARDGEFRYREEMGGGAMMDLGCYPVHWVRTILKKEPEKITATLNAGVGAVDVDISAKLTFPSGPIAYVSCSMEETLPEGINAYLNIKGSKGTLKVENPLQPEVGARLVLCVGDEVTEELYRGATFPHQLDYVIRQLNGEAPPLTGGADAIANMRVIDNIYQSADLSPRGFHRSL